MNSSHFNFFKQEPHRLALVQNIMGRLLSMLDTDNYVASLSHFERKSDST